MIRWPVRSGSELEICKVDVALNGSNIVINGQDVTGERRHFPNMAINEYCEVVFTKLVFFRG